MKCNGSQNSSAGKKHGHSKSVWEKPSCSWEKHTFLQILNLLHLGRLLGGVLKTLKEILQSFPSVLFKCILLSINHCCYCLHDGSTHDSEKCVIIKTSMNSVMFYVLFVLSRFIVFDSLPPYGLYPAKLLCPWDSPGKNTAVSCHAFHQGIFLAQGSKPGVSCLLHWQVGCLSLAPTGKPQSSKFLWIK